MTKALKIITLAALTLTSVSFADFSLLATNGAAAQQTKKTPRQFGPDKNRQIQGMVPLTRRPVAKAPKAPPMKLVAKNGAWSVQCEKAPDGKETCALLQGVRSKKDKRIGLTLIMGKVNQGGKTGYMMRVLAPIGVYLPTGIALEIDGAAVGRVPFTRCLPTSCVAFAEARKETIAKMKKGSKAKFLIYQAPGIGIPLELSLAGFTASLQELDKH